MVNTIKKYYIFILTALIVPLLLSGCGYDTSGWPRIELPFEENQITEISIFYKIQPKGKSDIFEEDYLTITSGEIISEIFQRTLNFPYKEKKEKNVDTKNYWTKVEVNFSYKESESTQNYLLSYYGYAVVNGVIVFNDGVVHFAPGDFVSFIYKKAKSMLE